jgi:hypothetical protein
MTLAGRMRGNRHHDDTGRWRTGNSRSAARHAMSGPVLARSAPGGRIRVARSPGWLGSIDTDARLSPGRGAECARLADSSHRPGPGAGGHPGLSSANLTRAMARTTWLPGMARNGMTRMVPARDRHRATVTAAPAARRRCRGARAAARVSSARLPQPALARSPRPGGAGCMATWPACTGSGGSQSAHIGTPRARIRSIVTARMSRVPER